MLEVCVCIGVSVQLGMVFWVSLVGKTAHKQTQNSSYAQIVLKYVSCVGTNMYFENRCYRGTDCKTECDEIV